MSKYLSQSEREGLTKEYEFCQSSAASLESLIWQTGAAIGLGSVGTLIAVSNHKPDDQPPAIIAITIGALISLTVAMWWRIARRWWSIQHTKFIRMAQIEPELGYFQARILEYLDAQDSKVRTADEFRTAMKIPKEYLPTIHSLSEKDRHQSAGVQYFLKFLPWVVTIAWVLYCGNVLRLFTNAADFSQRHFLFCIIVMVAWLLVNATLLYCKPGLHSPVKQLVDEPSR